jgi:cytoskeletal protein RodZ
VIQDQEMKEKDVFTCRVEVSDGHETVSLQESYVVASQQTEQTNTTKEEQVEKNYQNPTTQEQDEPLNPKQEKNETITPQKTFEKEIQETPKKQTKEELTTQPLKQAGKKESLPETKPSIVTGLVYSKGIPWGIGGILFLSLLVVGVKLNPDFTSLKAQFTKPENPMKSFARIKQEHPKFPEATGKRKKVVLEVAAKLQEDYGSFHGAGVYKVLEKLYGKQVSEKRISVEKQVNEFLRENPRVEFQERVGRKKLYKFKE